MSAREAHAKFKEALALVKQHLGKVVDAILSAEDNLILQYKVRSRFIGGRIFLINSSQVVEIKADRLVVEDALSAEVVAPVAISIKQVAES